MVFLFCVKKLLNQEKIYFCDIVNNSLVFSPHISCLFKNSWGKYFEFIKNGEHRACMHPLTYIPISCYRFTICIYVNCRLHLISCFV